MFDTGKSYNIIFIHKRYFVKNSFTKVLKTLKLVQQKNHPHFFFKKKNRGKLFFSKKSVRQLFGNFQKFPKKFCRENFGESFPENCGKLFRPTVRKETAKKSPGTFPKNGRTFRQNSLWKRVFSP